MSIRSKKANELLLNGIINSDKGYVKNEYILFDTRRGMYLFPEVLDDTSPLHLQDLLWNIVKRECKRGIVKSLLEIQNWGKFSDTFKRDLAPFLGSVVYVAEMPNGMCKIVRQDKKCLYRPIPVSLIKPIIDPHLTYGMSEREIRDLEYVYISL